MKPGEVDDVIIHMLGTQNVWAAMMVRSLALTRSGASIDEKILLTALLQVPISIARKLFDWLSQAEVANTQGKHKDIVLNKAEKADGLLKVSDAAQIPDSRDDSNLKIILAGHFGLAEVCIIGLTLVSLPNYSHWNYKEFSIKVSMGESLYCMSTS